MTHTLESNFSIEFIYKQVTDLQEQNRILQEQIIELQKKINERDQVILELRAQLTTLQNLLYGKSTEQSNDKNSEPRNNSNQSSKGSTKGGGSGGKKGGHRKRRDHGKLPLIETPVDLPEVEKKCPCCGLDFQYINDVEEGETVEIEVKGYRRKVRRRSYARKCKCPNGGPKIITAPTLGKLIPKGSIGTSVWIKMLLDKFLFYVPTYRSLDQMELEGIDLAQSTINDGMFKIKTLLDPIYQAICEKNRQEERWNADETGWLVQEKVEGKDSTRWYIWVFKAASSVVYRLSTGRSSDTLFDHLAKVDGTISCDRYSAYKRYADETAGNVSLSYCWAHVRRDYIRLGKSYPEYRTWATNVVENEIRTLYQLYTVRRVAYEIKGESSQEFKEAQESFALAMHDFQARRLGELDQENLADCQRKVNESLMEHWHGLTEIVHDPNLDMDNNAAERALRGPVIGRKNFWGSMMEWSGQLAVILFTILQTWMLWGINPKKWLEWYFGDCAVNKGKSPNSIEKYLPWNMSKELLNELSIESSKSIPDPPN